MHNFKVTARNSSLLAITTVFIATSSPLIAATFNLGEIEGQLDSSLAVGASWSLRNADPELIGMNNGGKGMATGSDDGRQNFKKGETYSKIFKGIHDLELKYGSSGIFLRGKYWYDFELKDESRPFKSIDDANRKAGAQASGGELLDAFLYHEYTLKDMPGTVRLGKQVVSWGESTFIQGGINSINPVDVSAFRRPGAEIKEGLIPVNMAYLVQNLTDDISVEAFYQLDWQQTVLENCGTFFSQNDFVADGCNGVPVGPTIPAAIGTLLNIKTTSEGIIVPRASDIDARNSGQWGAASRWFVQSLDAEIGTYFINYHSRQPYVSTISSPSIVGNSLPGPLQGLIPIYRLGTSQYRVEYPEDIQLYGLSFASTLANGTALSGEISYRPNMPLQLNAIDQVQAATGDTSRSPMLSSGAYGLLNNSYMQGYQRKPVTQMQVTGTHFFDQTLSADRITIIAEIGVTHVADLEADGGLRYGRDAVFGQGRLANNSLCTQLPTGETSPTAHNCNDDGFVTSTSAGYRLRAIGEYTDVIPAITIKPNIAWAHDVSGFGPEPGFNEGSKAISLGLDFEYQTTYSASFVYTDFFGGDYNTSIDRDFTAISIGMSF